MVMNVNVHIECGFVQVGTIGKRGDGAQSYSVYIPVLFK